MTKRSRPQRQKAAKVRHVQELRRSNAAGPHKPATDYNRKPKHGYAWEDDDDDDTTPFYWR